MTHSGGTRLFLILAPAGYGKSTTAAQFASGLRQRSVWATLSPRERSVRGFARLFAAAVEQPAGPAVAPVLDLLGSSGEVDDAEIIGQLIACLDHLDEPLLVVLDDYQAAECEAVNELIDSLLLYSTPELSLAIASRTRPELKLSRLRAQGQVAELLPADLALTADEIATLAGPTIDVPALLHTTGGWPAGVRLLLAGATAPDRGQVPAPSSSAVRALLVEEVLAELPDALRALLVAVSILDTFCASLASAVVGSDCGTLVDEVVRRALLVESAGGFGWYRPIPFFRDVLRTEWDRLPAEEQKSAHRRASIWYESQGALDEAIRHAVAAFEVGVADRLFSLVSYSVWGARRREMLTDFALAIADTDEQPGPHVQVFLAGTYLSRGQRGPAAAAIERARAEVGSDEVLAGRLGLLTGSLALLSGDFESIRTSSLRAAQLLSGAAPGLAAMAHANLAVLAHWSPTGMLTEAVERYSRAASLAEAGGDGYLHQSSIFQMAVALRMSGQVRSATDLLDGIPGVTEPAAVRYPALTGPAAAERADIAARRGDHGHAWELIEFAVELADTSGNVLSNWWSLCRAAQLHLEWGEIASAHQFLARLRAIAASRHVTPWFATLSDAIEGRLLLREGDTIGIQRWIARRGLSPTTRASPSREAELAVYASVLASQHLPADALAVSGALMTLGARRGRYDPDLALLHAGLLAQTGRTEAGAEVVLGALHHLENAGEGAAARRLSRFVVPYVDQLRLTIMRDGLTRPSLGFLNDVASAGGPAGGAPPAVVHTADGGLFEQLSARELELLQAIAAGRTNMEIAEEYFISLNTVKTHLKNIYAKLGVRSRTMATVYARNAGLIG